MQVKAGLSGSDDQAASASDRISFFKKQILPRRIQIPSRDADFDVAEARGRQDHVYQQGTVLRHHPGVHPGSRQAAEVADSQGRTFFRFGNGSRTRFLKCVTKLQVRENQFRATPAMGAYGNLM